MILEAIVTTINEDGTPNVSPMGPTVPGNPESGTLENFKLRPFATSQTFANLKRTKMGVLHVTDDVQLFARSAIGQTEPLPEFRDAAKITGKVITDACRWFEFVVDDIDETGPRMSLNCRSVHSHRNREFWGFNRGKHAVLEAAILATRLDFLPADQIREQFVHLQSAVDKTGGQPELDAFGLLCEFVGLENRNPTGA